MGIVDTNRRDVDGVIGKARAAVKDGAGDNAARPPGVGGAAADRPSRPVEDDVVAVRDGVAVSPADAVRGGRRIRQDVAGNYGGAKVVLVTVVGLPIE